MDMSNPRTSRWPLAGRDKELAELTAAWSDRRCKGLVIVGPAGVGKSRLAEQVWLSARKEGWKGRRATATAVAATVPLGAIAHLIPSGVDFSDPIKGFAQIARALAGPDRRWRWALLVDDLHLLDTSSAMLLQQLMDAGVVRLIATLRTGEPIPDAVRDLCSTDVIHRLDVVTLSQNQTDVLLQAALGGPVGRRTLLELHRASGGNVLYLHELVLGALTTGAMARAGHIWELISDRPVGTPRLMELIQSRLAGVDPTAQPLLELLALCEPLPLADAHSVAPLNALTSLENAGLVQVITDRRRTSLRLAHPLYGEALRASIGSLRRRALLLAQANRTRARGARRRDDALNLAAWHLAATGTADPTLLIQAAVLARHAHDFRQVVTLLHALPEEHHTTATRLLLGEAYSSLHRLEEAEVVLAHACDAAASEAERIVIIRARTLNLVIYGRKSDALRINRWGLENAESEVGKKTLQANEGAIRCLTGEPRSGVGILSVLADLERAVETDLVLDTWLTGASFKVFAMACLGQTFSAVELAEKVYETHLRKSEDARFQHPTAQRNVLTVALTEAGNLQRARSTGLEAAAQAAMAKTPVNYLWANFFTGRNELISGHLHEARDLCTEAAAEAHTHDIVLAVGLIDSTLAAIHAQLGDLATAQTITTESAKHPFTGMFAGEERLGEAWLYAARGDLSQARAVLKEASASARHTGHMTSEALLLTDIARLGGAKSVVNRLAELAQQCDGELGPARARFAAALASRSPEQLTSSAEELASIGADLLAAEAATVAAAAWSRAGLASQAASAMRRAAAYGVHCPGAYTPLLANAQVSALLTTREHEIALLAAAGRSSRDIAASLNLSVRTVDNHLNHVYTKLGIATRRELSKALDVKP
ncbi:helix-turn-helix transcriptional regulator [Streptomyces djakartensis]|uniref:helix-turn-helix transcriptional regulator n=1 Tax=Streptomyces djakartensis TaxID=68193 RepID=UPI0034DF84E3